MSKAITLFVTAICFTVSTGCKPVDVSMTVVTKGSTDDTFTVQKTQLKAVRQNVVGTYGKVISAKAIGYIKGAGVVFDSIIDINGNHYPAKLTKEVKITWDKHRVPVESVNGPIPGEIISVVSVNGVYYDSLEGLLIKSPPDNTQ